MSVEACVSSFNAIHAFISKDWNNLENVIPDIKDAAGIRTGYLPNAI